MKAQNSIRLGQRRMPPLEVPGEIFDVYQRHIGPRATLLWLNLRWFAHTDTRGDIEQMLQERTGYSFRDLTTGLSALVEHGLLAIADTGEYVINEPLSAVEYKMIHGEQNAETATSIDEAEDGTSESAAEPASAAAKRSNAAVHAKAAEAVEVVPEQKQPESDSPSVAPSHNATPSDTPAAGPNNEVPPAQSASPLSRRNRRRLHTPVESETPAPAPKPDTKAESKLRRTDGESRSADMDAVVQIYHKKIGMLGPTQFEKLRFWVEEKGMAGEVVALAIEETLQSAQNPRIQYLEGVLRNWHNDGIFSLQDLLKRKKASKVLSGGDDQGGASMEGVPNAAAYKRVDPDMVKKWKELYPDEYDG